jgi:DNA-binding SARP family transcriptional activator
LADMWVGVLGPLEVRAGGVCVAIPRGRLPVVLAVLALSAGRPVSPSVLADRVWGERLPQSPAASLQSHMTRLRRLVGPNPIRTVAAGYLLDIDPDQVDVLRFRRLAAEAARLEDPRKAREMLDEALRLWRGEPLEDSLSETLQRSVVPGLIEEHLVALQRRIDLDLAAGRPDETVAELRELTGRYPMRESLWHQLISALSSLGRQADALDAYHEVRGLLRDQLGVDPSGDLQDLYHQLLTAGTRARRPAGHSDAAGHSNAAAHSNAASDAGPARPVPPRAPREWRARRDLPGDAADFTGRDPELRRLLGVPPDRGEAAQTVVISAIDGMAGVGKTALAVHAAHLLADRFPDGQLFIDLHGHTPGRGPVEPTVALDSLLRAIGVPGEDIPDAADDRARYWRGELAGRRVLVLLDNAATAAQVRPLIPGAVGCLAIVTSRRRMTALDGARSVSLDTLPPDDALALLTAVVGAGRAAAESGPAQELLQLCGYLPLAIRICAARLAARPAWTVAYLAARLGDQRQRLAELETADRSVAAALSVSYRQLAPGRQRLYRLLGLHPGPDFDAYLAAAVASVGLAEAERELEALVDDHLLQEPAPGRYRFHDLLRDQAQAAAREAEPDTARSEAIGRMLDYYLQVTQEADSRIAPGRGWTRRDPAHPPAAAPSLTDQAAALSWCQREYANLMSVISYAAEHGWHEHAWRLPHGLWYFFLIRSHIQDWIATHHLALSATSHLHDDAARAETLKNLGTACWQAARHSEAIRHEQQALELFRRIGDRHGEAATLGNLGTIHLFACRYPQSLEQHGQALDRYRHSADRRGTAITLTNIGRAHLQLGQYHPAVEAYDEALAIFREIGDAGSEGGTLSYLGVAYERLGRQTEALEYQQLAVSLLRATGAASTEAIALGEIGNIYCRLGQPTVALDYHHQALALVRQTSSRYTETRILNGLAATCAAAGRAEQADLLHHEALALASDTSNPYEQARAHDGIAQARYSVDPGDAQRHWDQALAIYTELGVPEARALVRREIAAPRDR